MDLHNFRTVVAFEFLRTVAKPRFWIVSLAVPLLAAAVMALQSASNRTTSPETNTAFSFTYHDASGLVTPALAQQFGGTPTSDPAAARAAVQSGASEAFFDIPAQIGTSPVQVYGEDAGLMSNSRYSTVAQALVKAAATQHITDKRLAAALASGVPTKDRIYRNGGLAPGWGSVLLPAAFIVLFYMSLLMLGQQMLNVTLEEKENRVSEMILTTMNPTTLIIGKVVALVGVGILQGLVFSLPVLIGRLVAPNAVKLPGGLHASDIPLDPGRLIVGFLLFVFGFLLFAGILVAVGSVMPSAREAGSAFGAVIMCMFIPFYALMMIINKPHSLISTVFTYFPLTSPITSMLRNAVGALSWWEALIVLAELLVSALVLLRVGVRLFRTGSISYGSRVNIRQALQLAK